MIEPAPSGDIRGLEPVHELDGEETVGRWTRRLVLFLRVMAGISMLKGLYHWSRVCGIGGGPDALFEFHAVIWLTSIASMLAVEIFFPQVFGGGMIVGAAEGGLLALYLWLALKSAQEHVP